MEWQSHVATVLSHCVEAGAMTRLEANELQRRLARLAFNMTVAEHEGETSQAVVAAWLLSTQRRPDKTLRTPPAFSTMRGRKMPDTNPPPARCGWGPERFHPQRPVFPLFLLTFPLTFW